MCQYLCIKASQLYICGFTNNSSVLLYQLWCCYVDHNRLADASRLQRCKFIYLLDLYIGFIRFIYIKSKGVFLFVLTNCLQAWKFWTDTFIKGDNVSTSDDRISLGKKLSSLYFNY